MPLKQEGGREAARKGVGKMPLQKEGFVIVVRGCEGERQKRLGGIIQTGSQCDSSSGQSGKR